MEDFRSAFSQHCKDVETLHEKQRYVASIDDTIPERVESHSQFPRFTACLTLYGYCKYNKPGISSVMRFLALSYSSLTSLRVIVR